MSDSPTGRTSDNHPEPQWLTRTGRAPCRPILEVPLIVTSECDWAALEARFIARQLQARVENRPILITSQKDIMAVNPLGDPASQQSPCNEKLFRLAQRCRSSVEVSINQHRCWHQTLGDYLEHSAGGSEVEPAVWNEIVRRNFLIDLTFYPDTSVGSYQILHYDLEAALDRAHAILDRDEAEGRRDPS